MNKKAMRVWHEAEQLEESCADLLDTHIRALMLDGSTNDILMAVCRVVGFDVEAPIAKRPDIAALVGGFLPAMIVFYRREIDRLRAELEAKG